MPELQLLVKEEKISEEDMNCDGCSFFYSLGEEIFNEIPSKYAPAIFESRYQKIKKGQKYLYVELLDEETGEILCWQSLPKVNQMLLQMKLLPEHVVSAFN